MGITKSKIGGFDEIQEMLKEYRGGGALELQQYRAIGAVEECQQAINDLKAKDNYIKQILWERDIAIGQLEEIGVSLGEEMDSVKEARERHRAKKPKFLRVLDNNKNQCLCPRCGTGMYHYLDEERKWMNNKFCPKCGQAISWERDND